jgi:hypothetical protein
VAKTKPEAKRNLERAVERLGGPTKVAALCGMSEWAVKLWVRTGNLNRAIALNAHRFARAAGEPLESFLVDPEG